MVDKVLVFSDNLLDTFSKLYCIFLKPALAPVIFLKNWAKDERWGAFQSIKITVNCRPHRSKSGKSQKVKRSKGQKVKRSPWLCSWRDILASFLIMLSPALRMRSGCFHTITESPAIVEILHIIHINYHFTLCKSLFHHFISNNSSMGFLLPLFLPDLYTWHSENSILLYAYGKILHIEYCMQ